MQFGRWASAQYESANPGLWSGLTAAYVPIATGPTGLVLYDLSGRNSTGSFSSLATTAWSARGIAFSGFSNAITLPNVPALQLGTVWSVTIALDMVSATQFSQPFVAGGNGITFWNDKWSLLAGDNVVRQTTATISTGLSIVTMTRSGSSYAIYLNGINDTTTASDTGYGLTSTYAFNVAYANRKWTGTLRACYVHKRAISAAEARLLSADILAPLRRKTTNIFGQGGFRPYWAARRTQVIGGGLQ